jgi:ERCC4-type nuclease
MILYIDNREPKTIINYITNFSNNLFTIEIKGLDIGDYIIFDEKNNCNLAIFERKKLNDLESSIKDGRYNNQSFRLNENCLHNHNIYYLIEGSIINYKNDKMKNTLYSCITSLSFFKGFSILNSLNEIETSEIIINFIKKIIKEDKKKPYYLDIETSNNISYDISNNDIIKVCNDINYEDKYEETIKSNKSSFVNKDNINNIMLIQIPKVNVISATAILDEFKTLENLIKELKLNNNCLDNIKTKNNRKIGKNIIDSIKFYLL